jgi:hypothetical protein
MEVWKETIQEIAYGFSVLIESLNIPTAIPFFYDIDVSTGLPTKLQGHFGESL